MSKQVQIPACRGPYFEVTVNGMRYRYPAGKTVTVPDGVAALIEKHIEEHDTPPAAPELDPVLTASQITKAPALNAATEQTNVLAVENGAIVQLPASSLGGSGNSGGTIHVMDFPPEGELSDESEGAKYNVGDLCYCTGDGSMLVLYLKDESDTSIPPIIRWKQIYPTDPCSCDPSDSSGSPAGYIRSFIPGDLGATLEETLEMMGEGDFRGQILVFDDENDGTNSGAAIYLGSPGGTPCWKKITQ